MIKSEPIVRRGPPRIEDRDKTYEATKPWVKLKMSRSTWYRIKNDPARKGAFERIEK